MRVWTSTWWAVVSRRGSTYFLREEFVVRLVFARDEGARRTETCGWWQH